MFIPPEHMGMQSTGVWHQFNQPAQNLSSVPDFPVNFPNLKNWIQYIDSTPRVSFHRYSRYIDTLANNGFYDLGSLETLTIENLVAFSGMKPGEAVHLQKLVAEDTAQVKQGKQVGETLSMGFDEERETRDNNDSFIIYNH